MVDRLSTDGVARLRPDALRLLLAAAWLCTGASLHAAESATPAASALPDPTRPPPVVAGGEPAEDAKTTEAPPAGLQTVIMRKGAKPVAIINGQTVELGGKVGDAQLVKLSETEAVLQGPNGKEVLRLIPGAERKSVVPPEAIADAPIAAPKKKRTKLTK